MGNLVFQATLGGQVNLVGPNTASTYNINVPAIAGTLVTTGDTGTVTNTMLAGSIANAKLLNSSVTIGSTAVSLGSTVTAFAGITTLSMSSNLTLSGGTANGIAYLNGSNVVTTGSALTFDGSKLGVGTSSANAPIEVVYAASGQQVAQRWRSGAGNTYGFDFVGNNADNGWGQIATYTTGYLYWGISATNGAYTEGMRLTSTGLGIGTSSPAQKLQVVNTSSGAITYPTLLSNASLAVGGGVGVRFSAFTDGTSATGGITNVCDNAVSLGYSLRFYTYGSSANNEVARFDSAGNLGLGVTPSAWFSGNKVIDMGTRTSLWAGGAGQPNLGYNCYVNTSGNFIYKASDVANYYTQDGAHKWYNAPSGTAGNPITFTQAMTLDASGNLGVGTSSPAGKLTLATLPGALAIKSIDDGAYFSFWNTANTVRTGYIQFNSAAASSISVDVAQALTFGTNATERMRLDSSGNLGIGTTANASAILDAQSTTKGVRMPNMTTTQKNAIASPAAGLMVFDTTLAKLCVYSGSAWQTITSI